MQAEDNVSSEFLYIPRSALTTSFYLHLSLVIIYLISRLLAFFGIEMFPFLPKSTETLYQNYIQVDVVGLPDQRINDVIDTALPEVDEPKTAKKPEPVTLPTRDDTIALPPEPAKQE